MLRLLKSSLSVVLAFTLFLSAVSVTAYAQSVEIKRVNCCVYESGSTARGFCWYTESKTKGVLQLVKASEFNGTFDNAAEYAAKTVKFKKEYSHQVSVTTLEAGEKYFYRVGDKESNTWSETASFVTDDGDEKFSFITIADVQASDDNSFKLASDVVRGALQTQPESEFLVMLGDFVNDNTNEEWDMYFDNFSFVHNKLSFVPVSGNHDGNINGSITSKFNEDRFRRTFCLDESDNVFVSGVNYSFDYGNAHFAVLNTNDMWPMSQAQKNWLINDMSGSDSQWKILLSHRSLYSAGKNINKPDTVILRQQLIPIIDSLGIDIVFAGHDHMYLRTNPVKNDKIAEASYITEVYKGEETVFALNPKGAVHILPSTAGTKRYTVNEKALSPILDVAAASFSTRDKGSCFCTTEIDGDKLIYKAYTVDDETKAVTLADSFAVKKTEKRECIDASELNQGIFVTALCFPFNLFDALLLALKGYAGLLFDVIA